MADFSTSAAQRALSGSVVGDVGSVALLAPTVRGFGSLPVSEQIVTAQGVTVTTVGLAGLVMRSVPNLVHLILGTGSVDDVARGVVHGVPVVMPSHLPGWPGAMKDQGDDVVDSKCFSFPVIPVHGDGGVPLRVDMVLENPSSATLTTDPKDLPEGVDAVATELRDVSPLGATVIHKDQYTTGKSLVGE